MLIYVSCSPLNTVANIVIQIRKRKKKKIISTNRSQNHLILSTVHVLRRSGNQNF